MEDEESLAAELDDVLREDGTGGEQERDGDEGRSRVHGFVLRGLDRRMIPFQG